jgi:DNA-binding MarR family transcriptional regulator
MTPPPAKKDSIDRFIEASLALFPGVDPETEGIVDRIHKVSKHVKRSTERTAARYGLNEGEFSTLLKLRVAPDQTATAGDLAEALDLSTGAMTNRLDGLEERGLVTRERAASDRRSVLVSLTPSGQDMLVQAVEAAAKEEAAILSALSEPQRKRLNDLLRTVLVASEEQRDAARELR